MIILKSQTGKVFTINKGDLIKITDLEGQQVSDFWAFNSDNNLEYLSAGVSIDCNKKLMISTGDILYSNLYHPLFEIVKDTSGIHSLLFPCCRQEMYKHSSKKSGETHPNCLQNMNDCLISLGKEPMNEINPFNVFMNAEIQSSGKLTVQEPTTKVGDYIVLKSLRDNMTILITACSVDSGNCNAGQCSSIGVEISPVN